MRRSMLIHPDELSKKWVDRLKEAGIQVIALHPRGGSRTDESLTALIEQLEDQEYRSLLDYAAQNGLEIEYEMHAAKYLLPRELFTEHPEYFRENMKGERVADSNFCSSNEEALDRVAEGAAKLAKKLYRSSRNYYFWLDDCKKAKCYCDKCKELSASDQQIFVMNRILKKLREEDPQARLAYLAYYDTLTPPEKVMPDEGIFVEYAPMQRDLTKPVCEMPSEEVENISRLISLFGAENARVLEYWYDNSFFSRYVKPPVKFVADNERIKEDLKFYEDMGFDEIATFACFLGRDYEELYGEFDISAFGL